MLWHYLLHPERAIPHLFVPIVSAATVMCSAFAYADSHIYLSCTHGRVEEKITKQDGSVQTETRDEPFSLAVDIDFSHATVNGWRIMNPHSDTPIENQMMIIAKKFLSGDKYNSDTYMDLRIDRTAGTARLWILTPKPDACADEWKGDKEVCREVASTTIYQCVPASPRF